ncbi:uncharacterized protein LOC112528210 [Cynara cardunculus var. scolymus]|uniref:Uncharacterized protein n=1 Tax=Cynara cardunculus var. scolymus TaxID=59895 RepID=A0A103XTA7_CYNCS|nr:uncharacterized protein LOC112528210 [Cynara cardunculus var. scolymus]KVH96465.1 hypothetical protein Ccrd_001449 [Cynara cardunculus var. scolymus]
MELKSQKVNTSFFILLLVSHLSLVTPTNKWVGSKYQIECTMCAACDNPCNQPSPSPPPPASPICPPPPPPPTSSGGGGGGGASYYSPPPPTSGTGGGYYYSPPPPSQGVYYYYPPPPYKNYPNPGPPNPITNYYPYYYYSPPLPYSASVSLSGATSMLLINIIFICFFSL